MDQVAYFHLLGRSFAKEMLVMPQMIRSDSLLVREVGDCDRALELTSEAERIARTATDRGRRIAQVLFVRAWNIGSCREMWADVVPLLEETLEHITVADPDSPLRTVALADLIKDIKVASSQWIKEEKAFPRFSHWQDGYGAFTVSHNDKDAVIEYIKNQEEHHRQVSFKDELREFLIKHGVTFDEKYLD